MAKRVFELARELGLTSKQVLEKCRAEGLDISNHMSTLSAGLEATIHEWFSEAGNVGTAVETAEHVDLDLARKVAGKHKRKGVEPVDPAKERQEAVVIEEQAPVPADLTREAETVEVALAGEPSPEEPAQQAAAESPLPVEPDQPEEREMGVRREKRPKPEPVKPAGPQVVPRPATLKGPRVVRVERPDVIERPRQRRSATQVALPEAGPVVPAQEKRAKPPVGAPDEGEAEGGAPGKARKRSPRRRGSRTADSGDRIQEWRNQDLVERSERLAAAGGGLRRRRAGAAGHKALDMEHGRIGSAEVSEPITVKSLSAATGLKVADLIKKLMGLGVMATANQTLAPDMAEAVTAEYGIELVVKAAKSPLQDLVEKLESRARGRTQARPPVVTFLGHVDHGKTSLMDRIRNTGVAAGEAGGITQHIGAYRLERQGASDVVFLDTPGHEAFTAMRARGANMTDVVVLVVAADDGVMPQTVEAISHAKAAGVPIVVALNKVDLPNANIQKALGQLAEHGLNPREWGGDVEVIHTSATTGEGVPNLVETLSLEAELLELKAEVDAPASGYVIEAEMDPGFGALARLLVLNGALKIGDVLLAGKGYGHVRSIIDDHGRSLSQALPGTPVEVAGLDEIPEAGDRFYAVDDLDAARAAAEQTRADARTKGLALPPKQDLATLLSQIEAGEANELAIIIKADVQGSIEAITGAISKLGTTETRVKILHAAAGGISTGDVTLAEASGAVIVGFNVVADPSARQLAKDRGVDVRLYRIIYDLIDDIRTALEEGLAPEIREETLGRAEVRQVFKISKLGTVAGCLAIDGVIQRSAKIRIIRNNVVVEDGRSLESLKRFKDDAREVHAGLECGMKIAGYDDVKEGDILECYRQVEVARTLQASR